MNAAIASGFVWNPLLRGFGSNRHYGPRVRGGVLVDPARDNNTESAQISGTLRCVFTHFATFLTMNSNFNSFAKGLLDTHFCETYSLSFAV